MNNNYNTSKSFINLLNVIFEKEPKHLWKCYYKKFLKMKTWCIASDYCLDAKNKNNNCFVYTIFPYIDLNFLQEKINIAITQDIKDINQITENNVKMLRNSFFYTIAFIINEKDLFYKDKIGNLKQKDFINNQIKNAYEYCPKYMTNTITKLKLLYNESKKNNFNKKLYSNIYWNSIFVAYVSNFIYRYTKSTNGIIWISDRDDMCKYCNGVLFDLFNLNFSSINIINKTKILKNNKIVLCNEGKNGFEFDKLIRIPDYIAGAISSTDFKNNTVDKDKHLKINVEVIADNNRLVIAELFTENNDLLCRKIKLNKK